MGVENRIYIIEKHKSPREYGGRKFTYWGDVIAMYNAGKCPELLKVFRKETDAYIYADDENTPIIKDKYDKPLREAEIGGVIAVLEDLGTTAAEYYRIPVLLSLLRSLMDNTEHLLYDDNGHLDYSLNNFIALLYCS